MTLPATLDHPPSLDRSKSSLLLFMLTALNALNHLDRQLMSILLEPVRREFGLGDMELGALSGPAFAVVYALLGFPAAVCAVHRGRVNLIAVAAIVWGTTTAACGLVHSFAGLLLGRLGVGIGEAGATPAAQALISDLYEPGRRATAMSVFVSGLNAGVVLAFLVGGIVGQAHGWRTAFIAAGIATALVGVLLGLTVREPVRVWQAAPDAAHGGVSTTIVGDTLRQIGGDPVLRHVCLGAMATATAGYGALAWLPSFLVRAHGLGLATAGMFLAAVIGVGGAAGTWIGGVMSDRLRAHDIRWSLWLVALTLLVAKPFSIAAFLAGSTPLALVLFVLPGMVGSIFLGPSFAVLHDRVEPARRPIASAALLALVNLVGLGLGPLLVGVMSENLRAVAGPHSLGTALVVMQSLGVAGAAHYFVAGRRLASAASR